MLLDILDKGGGGGGRGARANGFLGDATLSDPARSPFLWHAVLTIFYGLNGSILWLFPYATVPPWRTFPLCRRVWWSRGGGATTTGPDATPPPPPAICQNLRGGGPAGGRGGGVLPGVGGGGGQFSLGTLVGGRPGTTIFQNPGGGGGGGLGGVAYKDRARPPPGAGGVRQTCRAAYEPWLVEATPPAGDRVVSGTWPWRVRQ